MQASAAGRCAPVPTTETLPVSLTFRNGCIYAVAMRPASRGQQPYCGSEHMPKRDPIRRSSVFPMRIFAFWREQSGAIALEMALVGPPSFDLSTNSSISGSCRQPTVLDGARAMRRGPDPHGASAVRDQPITTAFKTRFAPQGARCGHTTQCTRMSFHVRYTSFGAVSFPPCAAE